MPTADGHLEAWVLLEVGDAELVHEEVPGISELLVPRG